MVRWFCVAAPVFTLSCLSIRFQFPLWLLENLGAAYLLYLRNVVQSFSSHNSRQPDDEMDIAHFEWQAPSMRNNGGRIRSTWRKVGRETWLCELRIDNDRYQWVALLQLCMGELVAGRQLGGGQRVAGTHAGGRPGWRATKIEVTV